MKTDDAIKKAGSAKELAALFEITPSAISQWGKELPDARVWQLRVLRPEWFAPETQRKSAQKARA